MMLWSFIFIASFITLSYNRASANVWALSFAVLLILLSRLSATPIGVLSLMWLVFFAVFVPLCVLPLRRKYLGTRLLNFYRSQMPHMSRTEREALAAGTVTWEGDVFRGDPNWSKLLSIPQPKLTAEEQAFIDGPVETLCGMVDDWDVTHNRLDLPPEVWNYLKQNGFFGLIVPKQYGGKEFSAYAHAKIISKVNGRGATAGTTVSVPNSLGPAELLLHYGTQAQKDYYLPRLARGEEIPCFALTSPDAGSDASAMTDSGVICWGEYKGQRTLGIRAHWSKRYITLAPVATVIGLALKLYDPDHLLGKVEDIGITCLLIPRDTPGVEIGRRHFPVNTPFQNGPIHGNNVFLPLDSIIGGAEMAGNGWRMLMECLAAGRAISLPSFGVGGGKLLTHSSSAYARIRRQFNVSIGRFEGIEEPLARIVGYTYVMDAASSFTAGMIDMGEQPAVASAILKYHVTELIRKTTNDAMDIHGGKGICLGPKNYIGRGYESLPIAITVEGANILTRNLIIFGQGVMRCHPYILQEINAAQQKDEQKALVDFDKAIMKHAGYSMSNFVRSLILALTSGRIVRAPDGKTKRYFQQITRFSSSFALISDVSLLLLGGSLKRRERISARLGDVLSYLYIMSSVLKHYHDQGKQSDDLPLVHWACQTYLYEIQQTLHDLLNNYPNRWVGYLLRLFIFPLGRNFAAPSDKLAHKLVQLVLSPSPTRDRLTAGLYMGEAGDNQMPVLQDALVKVIAAEPIEKIIRDAKDLSGHTMMEQAESALQQKIISRDQFNIIQQAEEARSRIIAVDDFSNEELMFSGKKVTT